jgi:U-box domain
VAASCSSAPPSEAVQTAAAAAPPAAALATSDSTATTDDLPERRTAAAGAMPAADAAAVAGPDWSRCPLSGKVMRDPVLYGSEGHSFERAALERWVGTNPGVDRLTGQPLPPEGDRVLPNHAQHDPAAALGLTWRRSGGGEW